MGRLNEAWPEDAGDTFGEVFDDAMSSSRFGSQIVLAVPDGVDWSAWEAAHRPPPPWSGQITLIRGSYPKGGLGYSYTPGMKSVPLPPCSCALCHEIARRRKASGPADTLTT